MPSKRIRREDAIAVAEALLYDPECEKCLDMPADITGRAHENHSPDCAIAARDRILAAAENTSAHNTDGGV